VGIKKQVNSKYNETMGCDVRTNEDEKRDNKEFSFFPSVLSKYKSNLKKKKNCQPKYYYVVY